MIALTSRIGLCVFFVLAGLNHFRDPAFYLGMMPSYLPWHLQLIYISGIAEVLGGIGALLPATRQAAGWGLIALLICVFPANIEAAMHGLRDSSIPAWALWLRLPIQAFLIWWVHRSCIKRPVSPDA
jgi:uncharacterized membrane protein